MRELVGKCKDCQKEVHCTDGFFNGVVLEQGEILCFSCQEKEGLISLLNQLLEAEKAGVETLAYLLESQLEDPLFAKVKGDEAWSCQGLIHSIQREGGKISVATGDFAEKVKALPTLSEQLILLNKGQSWVVKRIDKALTLPMAEETRRFLEEMKEKHQANILQCEQIL
jgi:hypothetical protein